MLSAPMKKRGFSATTSISFHTLRPFFENIAPPKSAPAPRMPATSVSTPQDTYSMNRERLVADAKQTACARPRRLETRRLFLQEGAPIHPNQKFSANFCRRQNGLHLMARGGYASDSMPTWPANSPFSRARSLRRNRQRTIRPRPRARSFVSSAAKENPGTHRPHPQNRQTLRN